jgi:hypothetical protein
MSNNGISHMSILKYFDKPIMVLLKNVHKEYYHNQILCF